MLEAAEVASFVTATQPAALPAALVAVAQAGHTTTVLQSLQLRHQHLLLLKMAPQTQAVAAAALKEMEPQQPAQAAPASSSCLTAWLLAHRSFSNPRHRGLHRLAQARWITLLLAAVVVVDTTLAVAAARVVLEREPRLASRLAPNTPLPSVLVDRVLAQQLAETAIIPYLAQLLQLLVAAAELLRQVRVLAAVTVVVLAAAVALVNRQILQLVDRAEPEILLALHHHKAVMAVTAHFMRLPA